MSEQPLRIVVLGLSLSSSWGNGHATTWRALLKAAAAQGHSVTFLERDVPWYRDHRDLNHPDFCDLRFYSDLDDLERSKAAVRAADVVLVGSYVPDGIEVCRWVLEHARGATAYYDIDTPVTLASLKDGSCTYLSLRDIPQFDLYFSFTGGPALGLLEEVYGSRHAAPLYCSVDETLYAPRGGPKRYDLSYLGTYSPDRQPTLDRLLLEPARRRPDLRFAVAGPQYPPDIAWPDNVERMEHVAPADHASFYDASLYTLNVTRMDMRALGFSPSVRLFEAAACATPIISDRWQGLDTFLLPDREILIVDETDDVLRCLMLPETDRRKVALAARARVLAAHTATHRATELVIALRAAISARKVREKANARRDARVGRLKCS